MWQQHCPFCVLAKTCCISAPVMQQGPNVRQGLRYANQAANDEGFRWLEVTVGRQWKQTGDPRDVSQAGAAVR